MFKKLTLKGIRDSFSSKLALSPSRSTGNLDNVVSTVIADDEDEDDDIEGSLHLRRRNYPLAGSPLAGSPRTGASAASELNLGPRNEGPRKSLVQSLRYRIKSRKRLPLHSPVKVQAAQSYVPDRGSGGGSGVPSLHADVNISVGNGVGNGVDNGAASSLRRVDTMKDAHDNVLYSDVAADGTIIDDDAADRRSMKRHSDEHFRHDAAAVTTTLDDDVDAAENDDDDFPSDRANNALAASHSADSLLSDAGNPRQRQQQQQRSDLPSSASMASCSAIDSSASTSGFHGPHPTAERKALPRMGAKTLKLKSPSTSCISRGAGALSVASAADVVVGDDADGVVSSSQDSLLSPLAPVSAATTSAEEKMKASLTDSGCSIDATPASPVERREKRGFCSEVVSKSVSTPLLSPRGKTVKEEIGALMNHGWYWGPISRAEADSILKQESEGSFLVRDSSDPSRYLLSLSFKSSERVLHTRIQHDNGIYFFYHQPRHDGYASIPALIEHSMEDSQTGTVFCYRPTSTKQPSPTTDTPPAFQEGGGGGGGGRRSSSSSSTPASAKQPVRLITPISRLSHVRSLTAICKFEMKQTGQRAEA